MELVEREEFLDEMTTAFTEVTAGRGQFVLVSGEAGIGKTSLVETFTAAHERLALQSLRLCSKKWTAAHLQFSWKQRLPIPTATVSLTEPDCRTRISATANLDQLIRLQTELAPIYDSGCVIT